MFSYLIKMLSNSLAYAFSSNSHDRCVTLIPMGTTDVIFSNLSLFDIVIVVILDVSASSSRNGVPVEGFRFHVWYQSIPYALVSKRTKPSKRTLFGVIELNEFISSTIYVLLDICFLSSR